MNLFGWTLARAGKPPLGRSTLRAFAAADPDGSGAEWSHERLKRAAYLHNPVAQRAVRLIAEGLGGAELEETDPALHALVTARSGGQALTDTVAHHLLMDGNTYVQLIVGPDGDLSELYALRPDRVTVEADAAGWPVAYRYRVGTAESRLTAEDGAGRTQVVHLRGFHPLDDHYGLGCLGAAGEAVAVHNAAARWNRSLLENAARPSGALVYAPAGEPAASLSPDQLERLSDELAQSFSGEHAAGRPMLLDGGLSWQPMSMSPADMDFVRLKEAAARDIALAFGVPPLMLGLPGDNTYANYAEANRALWRQTILPLAGRLFVGLTQGLRPWFPDARLAVDLNRVPALADDREKLWGRVTAADFLTDGEKRHLLGVRPAPTTGDGA